MQGSVKLRYFLCRIKFQTKFDIDEKNKREDFEREGGQVLFFRSVQKKELREKSEID
jgi:hypothetical protein